MALSAEEFARLPAEAQQTIRAALETQRLVGNLLADPELARGFIPLAEKANKKANPGYLTTEEQAQPYVDRALAAVDAKLAARDKESAERQATTDLQAQIAAANARGVTDEGVKNVLKLMQEKGVGDFDSALKAYLYDNPPPGATPPGGHDQMNWNAYETMQSGDQKPFFFPEGVPSITDNPEAWERETALKYLNGRVELPTS